jgi:hypothetical protein
MRDEAVSSTTRQGVAVAETAGYERSGRSVNGDGTFTEMSGSPVFLLPSSDVAFT